MIMNFLKEVRASIYGPEYYSSLLKKPFSYSIKYFLFLAVCLALFSTIVLSFSVIPTVNSFLITASTKIIDYYPNDGFRIVVDHGKVSTNVAEPYFLKIPDELKADGLSSYGNTSSSLENLFVIDTKNHFSIDDFYKDRTILLVTGDSIAYMKDQSVVIQPISSNVSFVVDKGIVGSFIQKIKPYFAIVDWFIIIFLPVVLFVGMALNLVYLFIFALLVWALVRMRDADIGYKKSYQLGIHLMTLPLIITTLLWLFIPIMDVSYLFTVIAIVVAAANLKKESLFPLN